MPMIAIDILERGKPLFALFTLASLFAMATAKAESVTGTAAAGIAVDVRDDVCRRACPAPIGYSPKWGDVTDSGAYVKIEVVENADGSSPSTSVLATLAADAEGSVTYSPGESGVANVRLVHRVYSSSNVEIGTPLIRDVAFGTFSEAQATTMADTRTNSLQEAVSAAARTGTPVEVTYSTRWATNGVPATVTLKARRLNGQGGAVTGETSFFAAQADAEGETPLRRVGSGWMRLVCQVADAEDATLLEYVTDDFLLKDSALVLFVK
jgi:hypothetical protein